MSSVRSPRRCQVVIEGTPVKGGLDCSPYAGHSHAPRWCRVARRLRCLVLGRRRRAVVDELPATAAVAVRRREGTRAHARPAAVLGLPSAGRRWGPHRPRSFQPTRYDVSGLRVFHDPRSARDPPGKRDAAHPVVAGDAGARRELRRHPATAGRPQRGRRGAGAGRRARGRSARRETGVCEVLCGLPRRAGTRRRLQCTVPPGPARRARGSRGDGTPQRRPAVRCRRRRRLRREWQQPHASVRPHALCRGDPGPGALHSRLVRLPGACLVPRWRRGPVSRRRAWTRAALIAGLALVAVFLSRRSTARSLTPFPAPRPVSRAGEPRLEDFVGAERCASCHPQQYAAWRGSTHGRAGGAPGRTMVLAPFGGPPIRFRDAVVTPVITPSGEYAFTVAQQDRPTRWFRVDGVIGGWHRRGGRTQRLATRYPDGTLRFLPFEFIRREAVWF